MLARSHRNATPATMVAALLAAVAALALCTGVALARPAHRKSHHKATSHALVRNGKVVRTISAATSSADVKAAAKTGSKKGGSTGGSKSTGGGKGSKGSKAKTGGSKGTGGSTEGKAAEGAKGGEEAKGGEGGKGSEETKGNEETKGAEGSKGTEGSGGTEGSKGEETKGSEGSKGSEETKGSEEAKGSEETKGSEGAKETSGTWWKPAQHLTWYWQLQGTVNNSEPVEAYDIDGFENTAAEVATLHGQGKHVVCYIDVGTWEEWRSDAAEFPASVIGKSNGWPGEKYLNIADTSVIEPIMAKRFQMCKEKGFDAVEPDNMEDYAEKSTGFTITAAEQLSYDEWIAGEVHSLGMAVLQKNDGEQTAQLEPYFDGALTEQCNQYKECSSFDAYLAAGKPVLNAEYSVATSAFCAADNAAGIMGARYDLELDGKTFEPCW